MPLLKPARALQINLAHPMARGLVACWLLNEGTGPVIFDSSRRGNNGAIVGAVPWAAGGFGSALDIPSTGNNNYVQISGAKGFSSEGTFVWWANPDTIVNWGSYISARDAANNNSVLVLANTTDGFRCYHYNTANSVEVNFTTSFSSTGLWTQFAYTWSSLEPAAKLYINGVYKNQEPTISGTLRTPELIWLGTDRQIAGRGLDGRIDHVLGWNRVLSAGEIAHLYREPFCMFQPKVCPGFLSAPAGQVVSLAGSCTTGSSTAGSLKVTYRCTAEVSAHSSVSASLTMVGQAPVSEQWFAGSIDIEQDWLLAALFGGMTANAFKLGTALSLGWFWMRRMGCCVLYRGPTIDQIDFVNALAAAEQEIGQISPPPYLAHDSSSTYFYALRRFNGCGYQERTLAAVAKVVINAQGNLAAPQPNSILSLSANQIDGDRVRLVWFYCSLAQGSQPQYFKVCSDGGTGQIDYENPIATLSYKGQKCYSYRTNALQAGTYLFAVRAEDAGGTEDNCLAQAVIQLTAETPEAVEILNAESV